MKSLEEELLDYFNNTPQDVLNKDWETIHGEFAYGVKVQDFIANSKKILGSTVVSQLMNVEQPISETFDKDVDLSKAA